MHFVFSPSLSDPHDILNHTGIENFFHELVGQSDCGTKVLGFGVQSLLSLRIKGRVLNETVDEDPQVLLYLVRLDVELLLVLYAEFRLHFLDNLVSDVLHMGATTRSANAVDEGNLLELTIT